MSEATASTADGPTADDGRDPGDAGRRRGGDTRCRIQRVALELFAEQGYASTSLREIAERLGVTKAALYYHFKSKEDIVHSLTDDYFTQFDALIDWARSEPVGSETRHAVVDRYLDIVRSGSEVFRFIERNQAAMRGFEGGKHRFEQFRPRLEALVDVLAGPGTSLRDRIRMTMALLTVNFGWIFFSREDLRAGSEPPDQDELRTIILEMADDLIDT